MKFIIPNIIFIILIASCTAYLSFLTSKGSLTNNTYKRIWDKLTGRGRLVLYVSIFLIFVLAGQEINTQNTNKREISYRDSIITAGIKSGVDSSSNKLFNKLSLAFAKQNLKIDTLSNSVITLKDSAKTIVNNYSYENPVLTIEGNGVMLKSKQNSIFDYSLAFTSNDAGSTNFNITIYMLTEFVDSSITLTKPDFLNRNIKIPKGGKWSTGFQIDSKQDVKNIYFYVKGNYSTLDEKIKYKIDQVYIYEEVDKITSTLISPKRENIIRFIKGHTKK